MNTEQTPNFSDIQVAAKREQWDFVDKNLEPFLTRENFAWALEELQKNKEQNRNIRDLAATILDRTDFLISHQDFRNLMKQMLDRMEYHIVRFRVAIALYKRGNRDLEVATMMEEASKDPDVGELAKSYLNAQTNEW